MNGRIIIDVEMTDGADPERVAERLFDFMAEDPDDLFPEIRSVVYYQGRAS